MNALPTNVIERLFGRLQGIYGSRFIHMFSTGVDSLGIDRGFENAKTVWAEELSGFAENLNAIRYAVQVTEPSRPPTAREFLALCRNAPVSCEQALPYKQTADDKERARNALAEATKSLKPRRDPGIDTFWATHPKSMKQLKMIFSAAENDPRFRPCITEMVETGICTPTGSLLKYYRDGAWVNITQSQPQKFGQMDK